MDWLEYIWYAAAGIAGGVLGGMGMGGGTVLIPLLSIFYNVTQHTAQAINLMSFIPMAVIALLIHLKNRLVDFKGILYIILPGLVACVLGCYVARVMNSEVLRRCFGGFLLLLSVFQIVTGLKKKNKK